MSGFRITPLCVEKSPDLSKWAFGAHAPPLAGETSASGGASSPTIVHDGVPILMTASIDAPSTPQVAVNDIGDEEAFLAAIDDTIKYFNDGDIVEGVIVKVDRD